ELVELYSYLYIGYLLLDEAEKDPRKIFIANRYIVSAVGKSKTNADSIKNDQFSDLLHADEILR
ncbi:MAG: acyl-CoA dehydrogenase, partial [Calditrichaeota bacterium]|nr:acyl-CoA dehydrogenase [Calditrichota bacterium]